MAYRLFAFWDKESRSMVVATHGLIKKSQKTPPKEIRRAEELNENVLRIKTRTTYGQNENLTHRKKCSTKASAQKGCPARDDYEAKTEDYLLGMTIRRA